jgi:hypothetical protein
MSFTTEMPWNGLYNMNALDGLHSRGAMECNSTHECHGMYFMQRKEKKCA